jgi:hypothetical protein
MYKKTTIVGVLCQKCCFVTTFDNVKHYFAFLGKHIKNKH